MKVLVNDYENTVFQLIKNSIWKTQIELDSVNDWNDVITEMRNQAILGLISGCLSQCKTYDGFPHDDVKSELYRIYAQNIKLLNEQSNVVRILSDNNIPSIVLKGFSCAVLYQNPYQRTMGDIDILVEPSNYDKAIDALIYNGFTCEKREIETKRHTELFKGNVEIEIHSRLSDIESGSSGGSLVDEVFKNKRLVDLKGTTFYSLPIEIDAIMLLAHIKFHMKRSNGIGLRQIVDWMLFVEKNINEQNWTTCLSSQLDYYGLKVFAQYITKLCVKYMGLPPNNVSWCLSADDRLTEQLMHEILSSGNFGIKQNKDSDKIVRVLSSKRTVKYYVDKLQNEGNIQRSSISRIVIFKPLLWIVGGVRCIVKCIKDDKSLLYVWFRATERKIMFHKLKI